MLLNDFDYYMPEELIAQTPLEKRSDSRLMVLDRKQNTIEHKYFYNIADYLNKGDVLVLNDTKVIPARLFGVKENTGTKIEFVLLKRLDEDIWEVILKPGRTAKKGTVFIFANGLLKAEITDIIEGGNRTVKFYYDGSFEKILDKSGIMPLPPYIREKLTDKERYQTIYRRNEGSAAAPTAGLHFTPELLEEIRQKGTKIVYLTLHVGLGTFRPVKEENILLHRMHTEYYELGEEAASAINAARERGNKVIAVGTTSVRTLEACGKSGRVEASSGETDIFIYPGFKFNIIDGMITNFHLPKSTLLMLVCAFAGREFTLDAYKRAVEERYRFFSFGDAMVIL